MNLPKFKIISFIAALTFFSAVMIPSEVFAAKETKKGTAVKETSDVSSSTFESRGYDLGLVLGFWMPGTISADDYVSGDGVDLDKSAGPLFRAFADAYVVPKFAVGCFFNYSSMTLSYGSIEADASFYEFGIAMKPRFVVSPVVAIKPGLNIGYRSGTIEGYSGDSDGLALNLSLEVQYLIDGDYILFFEGGFLTQPVGGTTDYEVTWAPIIYLAGGICF